MAFPQRESAMSIDPRLTQPLRNKLQELNMQIATATSPISLKRALQQYLETALRLSDGLAKGADSTLTAASLAAPFIPGGAVVSAAISGTRRSSSGNDS
jgi:hypothetical protein